MLDVPAYLRVVAGLPLDPALPRSVAAEPPADAGTKSGPVPAVVGADTAERLLSGGQRAYASALLQSATRHNCTSPVIVSLLDLCRAAA